VICKFKLLYLSDCVKHLGVILLSFMQMQCIICFRELKYTFGILKLIYYTNCIYLTLAILVVGVYNKLPGVERMKKCSVCNRETSGIMGDKFCIDCGSPIASKPQDEYYCGNSNCKMNIRKWSSPYPFNFCGECGSPVICNTEVGA